MRWFKGWLLLGLCAFACGGPGRQFDPAANAGSGGTSSNSSGSPNTTSGTGGTGDRGGQGGSQSGGSDSAPGGEGGASGDAGASGETGKVEAGQPCSADAACASGYCRDEVCCATDCGDGCMACAEEFTGQPSGSCQTVQSGFDPHDDCAEGAPESCGDDGSCDGAGACRKFGANQVCGLASCTGTQFAQARTCDGDGSCVAPTTMDCGVHPCKLTGCAAPCTTDAQCPSENYCATGGVCNVKKTDGQACMAGKECRSNSCADGVCCESACDGSCRACSEAKTGQTSGRCLQVPSGQDPDSECAPDQQNACGRDGSCNGSGACRVQPSGKACGSATCSGNTLTPAGSCDGASSCAPSSARSCPGGTVCASATACVSACTKDTECAAGNYCKASACLPKKGTGVACERVGECTTGVCVDGVCCSGACSLACQGCSNAATGLANGTCGARMTSTTKPCPNVNPTACVNLQEDANHCSACGSACSNPSTPNTVAACDLGICGAACSNPNYQLCWDGTANACAVASWGFEGGNIGNWHNLAENSVAPSSKVARTGTGSLEATGSFDLQYPAVAETSLCYDDGAGQYGTFSLPGKRLSGWVYLNSSYTDVSAFAARCRAFATRKDFSKVYFPYVTSPPVGQWFQVSGTFGANEHQLIVIGVECEVPADWAAHATKRWFVDDFSVQN